MGQLSFKDEMTIRHQFDRLCQTALKGEAINYCKYMDYRRKHEVTFSELSEKKIRMLISENAESDYCFTVQVGNKLLINQQKFEEFLNQTTAL